MIYYPHGSFGFRFSADPRYTLITLSGTWNHQCAEIYSSYLRKRIFHHPDERRCVIIDARDWGFHTPESSVLVHQLNEYIARHYRELHVAYVLSPGNIHMARLFLDDQFRAFRDKVTFRNFEDITEAVEWLRSSGYHLPDLGDDDFPEALPAESFLNDAGPDL